MRANAPKWEYADELEVASSDVRGMREITKREQVITFMKFTNIFIMLTGDKKTQRNQYIYYAHRRQKPRALA